MIALIFVVLYLALMASLADDYCSFEERFKDDGQKA